MFRCTMPAHDGDDVDDSVNRADLMKVNLVDRHVVDLCFGGPEQLERAQCELLHAGIERRS